MVCNRWIQEDSLASLIVLEPGKFLRVVYEFQNMDGQVREALVVRGIEMTAYFRIWYIEFKQDFLISSHPAQRKHKTTLGGIPGIL
jgi:hypothetical protein